MLSAIISDLSLVAILQYQRHAVETALSFKLSLWNQAHIGCSSMASLLYIPMVILGICLLRGKGSKKTREIHAWIGYTTLLFRTLGFFLMFSMLKNP